MATSINISMVVGDNPAAVIIPVSYTVSKENEKVTIYHCTIDLPEGDIPEWLSLKEFEIRQVYSKGNIGVTITEFIPNAFNSTDAALFASKVRESIKANASL